MRPSPSGIEYRVLGSVEAVRGDSRIDLGGPRHRALLAVLVLHRNQIVSTDRLIELMWGDRPPANAANTVHVLVSHLRRSLARDGEDGPLVTHRPGYRLSVEAGCVDVEVAERFREEAAQAMAAGDPRAAADALRRAVALWRGEPLPELRDSVELAGDRRRLAELRLDVLEERLDADLACGRHRQVANEAAALLRLEPLRERLRGQVMLALYRCGRQADALEVYRDGRTLLVETLGVEPSPDLRALERAILNHDPALRAPPGIVRIARRGYPLLVLAGAAALVVVIPVLLGFHSRRVESAPAAFVALVRGSSTVSAKARLPRAGVIVAQPDGTAWVADTTAGTLKHIGPGGRVRVVGLGGRPSDLAWGFGMVWVGAAADRRLTAYDPATGSTPLTVGLATRLGAVGEPAAHLAIGSGSVWVDNGGSAGVWRINPVTGRVEARIRHVQTGVIASGMGAVWVAGNFFGSPRIDRISPATNRPTRAIPLPAGTPIAMTAAGGDLWVATDDGSLWRVAADTGATTAVPVRGAVEALAAGPSGLWVVTADAVLRLDPATGGVLTRVPIDEPPAALAATGAGAWVVARRSSSTSSTNPRHGTITIALNTGIDTIDPAVSFFATVWQLEYATELRLLTYPDVAGPAGTHLVPDAATAMPVISENGHTYTFTIRRGLRFWPGGQPVTAASFRAGVERALSPGIDSPWARGFMADLVGASAFEHGHGTHISGIRVDGGDTISFTTTGVDTDFPTRIAMPFYAAVPPNTPDVQALHPLPTAGPYYIAAYRPHRLLLLRRNPGYRGPRRGAAAAIRYRLGGPGSTPAWRLVATGRADYDADPLSPAQLPAARRVGGDHIRLDVQPAAILEYLALNMRSPRMHDPRLRRAIALAIDRSALAATHGPDAASPTDQYLPPTILGYPGTGLAYRLETPDVSAAHRLVDATGMHQPITLRLSSCSDATCRADGAPARARLLRSELRRIGIRLVVRTLPRDDQFMLDTSHTSGYDIADEGFVFPNPDPSLIEYPLTAEASMALTHAIRAADHAPIPARYDAWAHVDFSLARRQVPLAAYAIANTLTLTNTRLGCVVVQPVYGLDLTRGCVTAPSG